MEVWNIITNICVNKFIIMGYDIKKATKELIDKNSKGRKEIYPFSQLKVGEMFTFAKSKRDSLHACITHQNKKGKTFGVRTISDKELACVRIK